MSPDLRALLRVAATMAGRVEEDLEQALTEALGVAAPQEVEEVLLQGYLFLGYPAALNAFARWRRISGRPPDGPADDRAAWAPRGERVCQVVYGGQYEGLRENVRTLHPDMERWMVEEGYGKVLGRPGLSLLRRELCIVALLAVLDAPRQLHSHLRGALNVGAEPSDIDVALEVAAEVGEERGDRVAAGARAVWTSVYARWRDKGGD